jgi:hypothetical protein
MINIAARDLFLNALAFCLLVLIIIIPWINPTPTNAHDAPPPGNLAVSIAWPEGPYDVDVWVLAPGEQKAVGYSNRAGRVFNLLRDDLGLSGDDGPFNREDAFSRGLPAGEYVVNIHGYSVAQELPVEVEIRRADGNGSALLVRETMTIRQAQERTVVRFRLDASGNVVPGSMNRVYKPLRSATK